MLRNGKVCICRFVVSDDFCLMAIVYLVLLLRQIIVKRKLSMCLLCTPLASLFNQRKAIESLVYLGPGAEDRGDSTGHNLVP